MATPVWKEDATAVARELDLYHVVHPTSRGYSGHQETCYSEALARGADILMKLPPDYQYSPRLLPAIAVTVASGHPWTRDRQPMIPTVGSELLPEVWRP